MINGSGGGKKLLMLVGSTRPVFAVFGGKQGWEVLAEPGLGDGIVEDAHVVGPVAVTTAIGMAVEVAIAGEVVAALARIDVGFVELVIAGRAIVEEDDFRGVVA